MAGGRAGPYRGKFKEENWGRTGVFGGGYCWRNAIVKEVIKEKKRKNENYGFYNRQ